MAFPWMEVGTFLTGVGSVGGAAGGLLGKKGPKASEIAKWNFDHYRWQTDWTNKRNRTESKWYWKNQIPAITKAARNAGISPLVALGAPAYSPQGQYVGGGSSVSGAGGGSGALGALGELGQGVGRAAMAYGSYKERQQAKQEAQEQLNLNKQLTQAQIDYTNAQTRKINAPGTPPPLNLTSALENAAAAGSADGDVKLPTVHASVPGVPSSERGAHPSRRWERTPSGFRPRASGEIYQEQDITNPDFLEFYGQNRIAPVAGGKYLRPPPDKFLPKGAIGWNYDPLAGEYRPVKSLKGLSGFYFTPRKSLKHFYRMPPRPPKRKPFRRPRRHPKYRR